MKPFLISLAILLRVCNLYAQAPVNDNCSNALPIPITGGGFDLGTFVSATSDLTNATVAGGEYFDSSIPATLQSGSVWYSFTLPTARGVDLLVEEPTGIDNFSAAFAGFALYYSDDCSVGFDEVQLARLVPQGALGHSANPCLLPGNYLLQVVCNQAFNGPIEVTLELTEPAPDDYDYASGAASLGTLSNCMSSVPFMAGCLTLDNALEYHSAFGAASDEYTQSAWFTFTTPASFDELAMNLVPGAWYPYSTTNLDFAYTLYEGDVAMLNYNLLPVVDTGQVFTITSAYNPIQDFRYRCGELLPNTTYSIRFVMHQSLAEQMIFAVHAFGGNPTAAPAPSDTPASNNLGILSAGNSTASDWFGCNSRMELNDCGTTNPDTGIVMQSTLYNLSTWFTFELASTSNITITGDCWSPGIWGVWLRLYDGSTANSCVSLNYPDDLVMEAANGISRACLPAGIYTIQVLGRSYDELSLYYWDACNYLSDGQLGRQVNLNFTITPTVDINVFSLEDANAFDAINGLSPLPEATPVQSQADVFGCANTVMPDTVVCEEDYYYSNIANGKAIYREFVIGDADMDMDADSGIVTISGINDWNFTYRLYSGSASALATSQSAFSAGQWISGLDPVSECLNYYNDDFCCNGADFQVCVTPGTYTLVTFGDSLDIALSDQVTVQFDQVNSVYSSPSNPEILGDVWATTGTAGGTVYSTTDHFDCHDNAISLGGVDPCGSKAIYREFYLSQPSLVTITTNNIGCWWGCQQAPFTVFSGSASQNIGSLNPVWTCTTSASTGPCVPIEAGWYTVVSYYDGPTYEDPFSNSLGTTGNGISLPNEIYVSVAPPGQNSLYNRPHKACVDPNTGDPTLITWGPNEGDAQWTMNENTFYLCTEYFGCANDTPWTSHPILACDTIYTKVAYYVFETTQSSFLSINTGGYQSQLFNLDVRTDSLLLPFTEPIQDCNSPLAYNMQFCNLPPGVYTLVIWASEANYGQSCTPVVYIDDVGYSRFDFASRAYDFGLINPDNTWYDGKVGDVNPYDPSRAASNDFFYCTTGAFSTDPAEMSCYTAVNDSVYSNSIYNNMFDGQDYAIRRNLWYTFVLDGAGTCNVSVLPKPGKNVPRYAIYTSDVNGSLPFTTLQATGQVDSTLADGLSFVTGNLYSWWCYTYNEVSFYRDPCQPQSPTRYYIVVEHNAALDAINSQCEVSIKYDPLVETPSLYDHFSQANAINGLNQVSPPYTNVPLGSGSYTGDTDIFVCASADATDPWTGCGPRTLWYYFDVAETGYVRYRGQFFDLNDNPIGSGTEVRIYREMVAGDSSQVVLQEPYVSSYYDGAYWNQACVYAGRYYLMFTGCSYLLHKVYPEIQIIGQNGDFCSDPIVATINGFSSTTASAVVDCHTIGEDFGESGNNMGCLIPSGADVSNYKSTWFRIDVTGTSSVDFTFQLESSLTTVQSGFIRYRILLGSCDAMNVGSCFSSAQTINTINCLAPGSYYLQVVTPEFYPWGSPVYGSVGFSFTTTAPQDPDCMPQNTCFTITSFTYEDACESDSVQFLSQATSGDLVLYNWQFGYNNATSTLENPSFAYPMLDTPANYTVILTVTNTVCNETAADTTVITVMPKPSFAIPDSIVFCDGNAVLINANPSPATSVYWPQTGQMAPEIEWSSAGWNQVYAEGSIGSCTRYDTCAVYISPLAVANLGADIILCSEDSVYINANQYYGESYVWSNGDTTSDTWLYPGISSIEWTYEGCVITDTIEVFNAESATPLGSDTTVCLGLSPYVLDATTAGAYYYAWQDGYTGPSYPVSVEGLYWVDIYTNACTLRDSVFITQQQIAPPVIAGDTAICSGSSAVLSGPVGFTYAWSVGDTTQTIQVQTAGIIGLQITDANGCQSNASVDVSVWPDPQVQIGGMPVICNGGTTSLHSVYGYDALQWSTGATTDSIAVNSPGWYYLNIWDVNGCLAVDSVEVMDYQPGPPIFVGDTAICPGGSATLSTLIGYDVYDWSNGFNTPQITVTESGLLTLTATTAEGCVVAADILISAYLIPDVQIISDTLICAGNTSVMLANHDPGSLVWSGPDVTGLNTDSVLVSQQGVYIATLTSLEGCNASDTLEIETYSVNPVIDGYTSICAGEATTLSGPDGFAYAWSTGDTTQTVSITLAGNYILTLTDSEGCSGSTAVDVVDMPLPQPEIIGDTVVCANESIVLTVNGAYDSYVWSNGSTTDSSTAWNGGWVFLDVMDYNGCAGSDSVFITEINLIAPMFNGVFEFCEGSSTTIAVADEFDSYLWSDGSSDTSIVVSANQDIALTVWDINGCSIQADTSVVMQPLPDITLDTDSTVCTGGSESVVAVYSNGIISWNADPTAVIAGDTLYVLSPQTVSVSLTDINGCTNTAVAAIVLEEIDATVAGDTLICSGVENSYTLLENFSVYAWSNGSNDEVTYTDQAGWLVAQVTDADGCTARDSIWLSIVQPPLVNITGDTTLCPGSVVTLAVTGSYSEIEWSNGIQTATNTVDATGWWSVTVYDANDCASIDSIEVIDALPLNPTILGNDIVCQGETIVLSANQPFADYAWTGGGQTQSITVGTAGNYLLQVWDNEGCTGSDSVDVSFFTNPQPLIQGDTVLCEGENTLLTLSQSYVFVSWNGGPDAANYSVNTQGLVNVEVTDVNGCSGEDDIFVTVYALPQPVIVGDPDPCVGEESYYMLDQSFPVVLWNGVSGLDGVLLTTDSLLQVEVTDDNGCVNSTDMQVTFHEVETPALLPAYDFCEFTSLMLDAGTGYALYDWSTGDFTQSIELDQPGSYDVTVYDAFGCSAYASTEVIMLPAPQPVITGPSEICEGDSVVFEVQSGYLTYNWYNGATEDEIVITEGDEISVTVQGNNLCFNTAYFSLTTHPLPEPFIIGYSPACEGTTANLELDQPYPVILWNIGESTQSIDVNVPLLYRVYVETAYGCSAWAEFNQEFVAIQPVEIGGVNGYCDGDTITVSCNDDFENYYWNGQPGESSVSISNTAQLTLIAEDAYGCLSFDTASFMIYPLPMPVISGDTRFCEGDSTLISANGYLEYYWSNGATDAQIFISEPDTIGLEVVDVHGCVGYSYVEIGMDSLPNFTSDTVQTICYGDPVELMLQEDEWISWWDEDSSAVKLFTSDGSYMFTISNDCGSRSYNLNLTLDDCDWHLYAPNAFTPDADGINDTWIPQTWNILSYEIKIFDRWGMEVFSTSDMNKHWTGNVQGGDYYAVDDVYIYTIDFITSDGILRKETGYVVLLR